MNFGQAIDAIKRGHKAAREGWNGKNQYIELASNISYINADGYTVNAESMKLSAIRLSLLLVLLAYNLAGLQVKQICCRKIGRQ